MAQAIDKASASSEVFSAEQIRKWKKQVTQRREELFMKNWKNRRQIVHLRSKSQVEDFQFVLEWCDEYGDVVGRVKERERMDKLIAIGADVNAPREEQPEV